MSKHGASPLIAIRSCAREVITSPAGCDPLLAISGEVALSLFTDFENLSVLNPAAQQEDAATAVLDQVVAWGEALRPLRK
ncbi:hypothetical protein [Actinomadura alba]|uniref:Uncharacterized protein n=1 Tax=Actinomadura alba TaxID=406431 RepID=A0ABR7LWI2_9ACTN|nr:hypothetical protein [Actinomadura alba]MBC6468867.1 hypothetical protein [Actinomadura alba]